MILECTHAVWDFSGLQPHVVSLCPCLLGMCLLGTCLNLFMSFFAERWESWTWNFQEQDW